MKLAVAQLDLTMVCADSLDLAERVIEKRAVLQRFNKAMSAAWTEYQRATALTAPVTRIQSVDAMRAL